MKTRLTIRPDWPGGYGFTLVELLVALAVASILLGVAAPSFRELTSSLALTREYNAFARSLRFARVEAIRRGSGVSVCARDGTVCGADWSLGWVVFAEGDTLTPGTVSAADTVLRVHRIGDERDFDMSASAVRRPLPLAVRPYVSFDARGRSDWTIGTLVLCDSRSEESALGMVINGAGGFRRAMAPPDDGSGSAIVLDAFGDAVSCPS